MEKIIFQFNIFNYLFIINFINFKIFFLFIKINKLGSLNFFSKKLKKVSKFNFYKNKNYFYNYLNFFIYNNKIDSFNYINYKNIINILFNLNSNNINYLIFDENYKYIYNLYYNLYSYKNLLLFKKYFFLKTVYFTHKNWSYFYNNFILNFKINLIFLFDYKFLLNYNNDLKKLDILYVYLNDKKLFFFDYVIKQKFFFLNKFIFFLVLNNIYYISYNHNSNYNKIKFIHLINKFN